MTVEAESAGISVGQEAHRHHFVPQFLLRPWCLDGMLHGYQWDDQGGKLTCKRKGTKSFCYQLNLLTLRAPNLRRAALEKVFFGQIDTKGAEVRDRLLADGPHSLNADQRCDFARLLLSLDMRRPTNVRTLCVPGARYLSKCLDSDLEIVAAMEGDGLAGTPPSYVEQLGISLADRALTVIQLLVDNPRIGGRLINAHGHVVRLGPSDGSLVLSDRPLIRLRAYDHPGAAWILPLTPKAAFVAVNHPANLNRIRRVTPQRFAKQANAYSANQAERFVFCADTSHEDWLAKRLRNSSMLRVRSRE